jgi:hypothetical protein
MDPSSQCQNHGAEIIQFFGPNVSSSCCDETILPSDETIFRFRADIRKQPLVISYQPNGTQLDPNRRQPMRTISFILGFAFILAGPSIAGSSDGSLPGIGTFSYNSPPALIVAPTVVAAN